VLQPDADAAAVLTVWIPITDATVENGTLEVVPGSHRDDSHVMFHCPANIERGLGPAIPEHLIAQSRVPVPMTVGSVLLLHKRIVHRSLDNTSENDVRLSFDLRYQRVGEPTGRPGCPGFVARSQANPDSVLRDWEIWARSWLEARAQLAEDRVGIEHFFRWTETGVGCA
jgi:ectoine hydroxylase-related dioxygenase (phytanoyl-CoA dioxygenase family)